MEYSQELREAIQDAFTSTDKLELFVRERLNEELADLVTLPNPRPIVVSQLLRWAQSEGRLGELVWEAHGRNPGNPKLLKLISRLSPGAGLYGDHDFGATDWKRLGRDLGTKQDGAFEKLVLASVAFEDVAPWLEKLGRSMRKVCRVEPQPIAESGDGYGTGFLVARDVILTNFHVVEGLANKSLERVRLRFDYFVDEGGVAVNEGRTTTLAKEWDLLKSPVDELDFALVRLAEPVGEDEVRGGLRSHFNLGSKTAGVGEPLLILQHPATAPLKLALGSITKVDQALGRLSYTANTLGGSSGSPCLNTALDVVALHHWGAQLNRGVSLDAIIARLKSPANTALLAAAGVAWVG